LPTFEPWPIEVKTCLNSSGRALDPIVTVIATLLALLVTLTCGMNGSDFDLNPAKSWRSRHHSTNGLLGFRILTPDLVDQKIIAFTIVRLTGYEMPENETPEWALAAFARQLAGIGRIEPGVRVNERATIDGTIEQAPPLTKASNIPAPPPPPPPRSDSPDELVSLPTATVPPKTSAKRKLATHTELANMILRTLRTIDGCPAHGFIVTAYGSNPWSAMLTIRPEAGRIADGPLWYARVREIGVQLRDRFDVVADADAPTGSAGFADEDEGRPA
jgi:hypothetical protein